MTQRYALMTSKVVEEGPLHPDVTLLRIITDDGGTILELTPARFREADARAIEIRQDWTELGQTTLDEFRTFIETAYGTLFMIVFEGAS